MIKKLEKSTGYTYRYTYRSDSGENVMVFRDEEYTMYDISEEGKILKEW